MKTCSKCKIEKPSSQFWRHAGEPDGLQATCTSCLKEYRKRYPKRASGVVHDDMMKHRYGITARDYSNRLAAQGGGCAICGAAPKKGRRLSVDHCHSTGKVRGLLCDPCNRAIGMMGDDPARLRRAVQYLSK